jgi:hypothetical protein
MALSLYEEDPRGPRRGAKGSCGTPKAPVRTPSCTKHRNSQSWRNRMSHSRSTTLVCLGSDRIVASDIKAPNVLVNLV